jgi:hypothetical protein
VVTRAGALGALIALVAGSFISGAGASTRSTFALSGEARALELALGDQGLTLGVALAQVDSIPTARGVGAGQCALLGDEADPDNLPCNESTTQTSAYPAQPGDASEKCAGPDVPAPLDSVLTIELACGSSTSGLVKGVPTTSNHGKVANVSLGLDVSGVIPQAEDAKEQLIDQLQQILDEAPEPIENALDQLLDALDEGQGVRLLLGPAASDVTTKGSTLTVRSTAAGAVIGAVGIPDLDPKGNPIPGSSSATEDGLIIVEVGSSEASVTVDRTTAASHAAASPAIVTVKVRDITKVKPTYVEISVTEGQSVTILEGTPAESTITAAGATTEEGDGEARAAADAVSLHLLKGIQGGVRISLGRTTATGSVNVVKAAPPAPPEEVLPVTGGRDWTPLGLGLIVLAAVALIARRRLGGAR